MEEDDERFVYWVEKRGRGMLPAGHADRCLAISSPRSCSTQVDTVVLTSATLAVAGGFDFVEKRLGLEHARTLIVPGHFDYQKQALLYVPQHLPEPRNPAFTEGGGRGSGRASWSTAAAARSCCSPAISRCGWCTTASRSRSNIPP